VVDHRNEGVYTILACTRRCERPNTPPPRALLLRVSARRNGIAQVLNPKPYTLNPTPETLNPELQTLNSEP